jgi:hypothetical protein
VNHITSSSCIRVNDRDFKALISLPSEKLKLRREIESNKKKRETGKSGVFLFLLMIASNDDSLKKAAHGDPLTGNDEREGKEIRAKTSGTRKEEAQLRLCTPSQCFIGYEFTFSSSSCCILYSPYGRRKLKSPGTTFNDVLIIHDHIH